MMLVEMADKYTDYKNWKSSTKQTCIFFQLEGSMKTTICNHCDQLQTGYHIYLQIDELKHSVLN